MNKRTMSLTEVIRSDDYVEPKLKFLAWGTLIIVFFSWLIIPIGGIIGWNVTNSTFSWHLFSAVIGLIAGVGAGFILKMIWIIICDWADCHGVDVEDL